MQTSVKTLLEELEAFGKANDAATKERAQRMLNITRDTGEFLDVLVRATGAPRILEIGTSNGYSTLWLAGAAQAHGGRVTTVEFSPAKIALARENFRRAGFADAIHQVEGDAGALLAASPDAAFDLIFLDAERGDYLGWWPEIRRVLAARGLLVVDNAVSHAEELAPFMERVRAEAGFATSLVPVGNGEFLATKA
ncbi:methyltransferase [Massilia sp. KIM]|uniref:O-methyltransferase n=1 Tax=Massilia sp. KIM TaxID=1955422 RepID=UPI0009901720|nr:O-methyltransferase [Massilia sp. KIM]OON59742.1 methyltransferase [Massilia sp. KIM]